MNQQTQNAIAAAATKAADLWTSYLDRPWDNGVPATNLLVANLQKQTASPHQKALFHSGLFEYVKQQLNEGNLCIYLGTDYSPDPKLEVLVRFVGMNQTMLPCKTFVRVEMSKTAIAVSGKCGYGQEIETTTYPINA